MAEERRAEPRGALAAPSNLLYDALRVADRKANSLVGTLGVFLVAGLLVAALGVLAFLTLASHVRSGTTQAFDDAVIRWMGSHHTRGLDAIMLEVTALGTGTVVMMIVAVAALFLVLTSHKYSAMLLLASAAGGIVLNGLLKIGFDRPRPAIFLPQVHTVSSSFPSGHAMSAAIVYSTVAYLAARLHKRRWARWMVMGAAFLVIVLISISRLYLGVHYPSDVVAGLAIGLAWAGFCMATLEAIQKFGIRRDPRILRDETPAPPREPIGSSTHRSRPQDRGSSP
jgi:undecaprenyl-diphosphatase